MISLSINFCQSTEILFCFVGVRRYALTNLKSDNMSTFEGDKMRFYATFCYPIVDRYFLINPYNSVCVSYNMMLSSESLSALDCCKQIHPA